MAASRGGVAKASFNLLQQFMQLYAGIMPI
jgi:hypothetical protein